MLLNIKYRAANDLDLRTIRQGRGSFGRNVATVSLPFGIVACAVVYVIWHSWWSASAVGIGLFAASAYSNLAFFRNIKRWEFLRTDSKAVEVLEVSADRVLDVEPVGDNAPALCFFVGEGKALLLVGQWLLDYDLFPSKSFCLHLWREKKQPIRIDVIGSRVDAEHSNVQLRKAYRLRQIELIDASPDTLQADLDSAFGDKRSSPSS
jgi:hypothetical protein